MFLYRRLVESHFEFVKVHPVASLVGRQVVVEIPRRETERVKL